MGYDDFSLPKNWEAIAKAYTHSLKDKGFVFVRMTENQKKKTDFATACLWYLKNLETLYLQAQKRNFKNQNSTFKKLSFLSSEVAKYIEGFYSLENQKHQNTQNNLNFPLAIFKNETQHLKSLMLLLDEEDNSEIRQFLKTSLHSRLEALSEVFV